MSAHANASGGGRSTKGTKRRRVEDSDEDACSDQDAAETVRMPAVKAPKKKDLVGLDVLLDVKAEIFWRFFRRVVERRDEEAADKNLEEAQMSAYSQPEDTNIVESVGGAADDSGFGEYRFDFGETSHTPEDCVVGEGEDLLVGGMDGGVEASGGLLVPDTCPSGGAIPFPESTGAPFVHEASMATTGNPKISKFRPAGSTRMATKANTTTTNTFTPFQGQGPMQSLHEDEFAAAWTNNENNPWA